MEGVVLELGLQHDPLGDVAAVQDQPIPVPVHRRLDVQPLPRAGANPALDPGRRLGGAVRTPAAVALGEQPPDLQQHPVDVVGVHQVEQIAADQLLRVPPVDPEGRRTHVREHAVGARDHDDVAGTLHQGAEVRLLLGEFLRELEVVQQHHALPQDQREADRAGRRDHHPVQLVAAQGVVEDARRADRRSDVGRQGAEGGGDPAARRAARRGVLAGRAAARGPGCPGEQHAAGEPAGVQQLAGVVAHPQLRRGEQGVTDHGDRQRDHGGVDGRPVAVPAPEAQADHQADQQDVQHRVGQADGQPERVVPLAGRHPAERETPAEGEQRARDQPAVQQQAEPAGRRPGTLGEHHQTGDGQRREQQEGVRGGRVVRQGGAQHDLVPAPGAVAEGHHGRGEAEQQPGRTGRAADGATVQQTGQRGGQRGTGQAEVSHEQRHRGRTPAEGGAQRVPEAEQDEGGAREPARPGDQHPRGQVPGTSPPGPDRREPGPPSAGRRRGGGGGTVAGAAMRLARRAARQGRGRQHRIGGVHSTSPPPARGLVAPGPRLCHHAKRPDVASSQCPRGPAPAPTWPAGEAIPPRRTGVPTRDTTPLWSLNDTYTQLRVMAHAQGFVPASAGSARLNSSAAAASCTIEGRWTQSLTRRSGPAPCPGRGGGGGPGRPPRPGR